MKILILRFSSIGDIVLTTPIIRCIKKQIPNAEIHFYTKEKFKSVIENNPYIHTIWTIKKSITENITALKKIKFDCIIDLHNNLRTFQIKLHFLFTKKYTFNKINVAKWLLVNTKINTLPKVHIVDRYFSSIHKLNISYDKQGLDFYINEGEINQDKLAQIHNKNYIVFAVGGTYYTKRLPNNKITELIEKNNAYFVLLGDEKDKKNMELISAKFKYKVINFCGELTLNESAFVLKNAEKVIAHDSGLMHIAAALNKPMVTFWGNTIPQFGMYPLYNEHIEKIQLEIREIVNLNCRPCSKLGFNECPKKHFNCMEKQNVERIKDSEE